MKNRYALFVLALATAVGAGQAPAHANFIYDEARDGDLSNDRLNPTLLIAGAGVNTLTGMTVTLPPPAGRDFDYVTVTIPAGLQFDSLVLAAYELLKKQSDVHFVGNVEPTGFFNGEVDVAVCDGFVGNMMLKTAEAVAEWLMHRVREAALRTPAAKLGGHLLKPSLRTLKQEISHSEHGGAVLLGLRGVVIKCHGRATADTIENGIKVAARALRNQVVQLIEESHKGSGQEVSV